MENESILVSVFPLAFTVVDHFTTLPLPTMASHWGQAPGRNKWLISKLIERNSAAVCYVKNRNKV